MNFKSLPLMVAAILLLSIAAAAPQQEASGAYDALRREAERHYAEKSFSRAHSLYEDAAKLKLAPADRRWVELRLPDTAWRADAASPDRDPALREAARAALETIVRGAERDLVWAEANESLGDYFAFHPRQRNLGRAVQYWTAALDWWAGSEEIERARRRYLELVWRAAEQQVRGGALSRQVLVNALQIAQTPEDRARARHLLARDLLAQRDPASVERALELLETTIRDGRETGWYDDALHLAATTYMETGSVIAPGMPAAADYPRALEHFRRLVALGPSTRYYHQARRAIDSITKPSLSVVVGNTFLPESEQEVVLGYRNVGTIELTLTAVDLTEDARFSTTRNWVEALATEGRPALRRWTYDTNDDGKHRPGTHRLRIEPRLEPGAYVVAARGAGETARQLVLVTDAHILLHAAEGRMHVFVSDVQTGEPIAGARVRAWERESARALTATTNAEGLAELDGAGGQFLITAAAGKSRQAYHEMYVYPRHRQDEAEWRIYAFTDRPAYRPGETVQWKMIARVRDEERWATPGGQTIAYEITSPRGEKVSSGTAKLNAFGSFWAEVPLTASMPLGAYTVAFRVSDGKGRHIGGAQLFRLEEYKLPEFAVTVSTPERRQYRLGDTIEATIEASYYFGGPVANAEVEAVVYRAPFHRYWSPWREFPWYWSDSIAPRHESVMTRETLRTDAQGRAVLRIDTPRDGSDMSYRIEARVVDASRREVRGEGTVRVTMQRYAVMAHPEHHIHRPGESVSVRFRAVDANDRPVDTTGTIAVVRRQWTPRWIERSGRRTDRGEYSEETILTTKLETGEDGEATLTFRPKREGHYVVRWTSLDGDGQSARDVVRAETAIWVADRETTELGYRSGALDLVVDRESVRPGETAAVMVLTPASGRWVVLTASGDGIIETRVLRLDGTAKLVQFPVDRRHIPNFFITASSVFDVQLATDSERIVVPPAEQFLTVDVASDREEYGPRAEGTYTITTRDAEGKPVAAEVALAVSDEAVTAIQEDTAGDPRPFFYGDLRHQTLIVSAGLSSQRYVDLAEREDDESEEELKSGFVRRERLMSGAVAGGAIGGSVAETAQAITVTADAPQLAPPPPAPAPAMAMDAMAKEAAPIDVEVRSDFRSTAFWKSDIVTGESGTATVTVAFPEALTTWRATARAATTGARFGMASSTARTNLPLVVRLQAPRFFVAGDRAVVSAVINNNSDEAMTVTPELAVEGVSIEGATSAAPVVVAARGEARADWTVAADRAGDAKLRVSARGATHGDAMERSFTVYEHGIDKLVARSGKLRGSEALIRLELPRERRATDLTIQVAPSLAVTMLDALPYLLEFPYGCTEQTMSRFLPAAIVARTLESLGLDREDVLARPGMKRLAEVTNAGMARLYDMQHPSGAWGWWKEGPDDELMTAYVVWGFALARDGGLPVRREAVERAVSWLEQRVAAAEGRWNDQAWMLHARSAWRAGAATPVKPAPAERRAYDDVWSHRDRLTAYSRALLALTAHRYGDAERARVLVRNLEDGVKVDRTPDQSVLLQGETSAETMATAHWGATGFWWRWYESPVETTAFVLQALVTIDPEHRLVEPAMNWLVKNRRGAQWSNTRDTAIALLALNDYLEQSGELRGDLAYEVTVNGRVVATKTIAAADVLRAPSRFAVDEQVLRETTQEIRIRRTAGTGPIYFSAEGRFVSLEEPVTAAGHELFVRREYFRLVAKPTLLKGVVYDRVPLRDGETIASGDRVEVVVTIDAKNDYSYLVFEDLKPAGFEAVALRSGEPLHATAAVDGRTAFVYQELRDRKVAMFADHLAQGIWEIRYPLRAEVPGSFHALPLLGWAMYAPDVRANGEEVRVRVGER